MRPASSNCCGTTRPSGRCRYTISSVENVYAAAGGMTLNIAGRENAKGVEIAGAIKPTTAWKFWGNFAYVDARYADYDFIGGSFSGNTPPNVPSHRRQCRRLLSFRHQTAGRTRDVGALCRQPFQFRRQHGDHGRRIRLPTLMSLSTSRNISSRRSIRPALRFGFETCSTGDMRSGAIRSIPIRSCSARRGPMNWRRRSNGSCNGRLFNHESPCSAASLARRRLLPAVCDVVCERHRDAFRSVSVADGDGTLCGVIADRCCAASRTVRIEAVAASHITEARRIRLIQRADGPVYIVFGSSKPVAVHAADLSDAAVTSEPVALDIAKAHARRARHRRGAC